MPQIDIVGFHREGRDRAESQDRLVRVVVDLEVVAAVAEYVVHLCSDIACAEVESRIGRRRGIVSAPAARPVALMLILILTLILGLGDANPRGKRAEAQAHSELTQ